MKDTSPHERASSSHQQSTVPKLPSKVTYLDGLRGVAALVVVMAHFKELALPGGRFKGSVPFGGLIENGPLMLLTAAHLAVLVFFVHSGFVLSWKFLKVGDGRILISMA